MSVFYLCFRSNALENITGLIAACNESNSPNHFIYCSGPILEAVMEFNLFKDSKTCGFSLETSSNQIAVVDKPLRYAPKTVLNNFNQIDRINRSRLMRFIDENFETEGTELKR